VGDSGRASVWYPLVGVVIGAFTWLGWKIALVVFPPLIAGVIALFLWVALTGGLHLDGLTDCCDGLLASVSMERRLEIMKDSHLGAFGAIGLTLALVFKTAILVSLAPSKGIAILLAASLARWCILPAGLLPQARPSGLGADFKAGFQRWYLFLGALLPLGLALFLGRQGWISILVGLVFGALALWLAKKRIGGVTGDVFGMVVEVVEVAALLPFTMIGA